MLFVIEVTDCTSVSERLSLIPVSINCRERISVARYIEFPFVCEYFSPETGSTVVTVVTIRKLGFNLGFFVLKTCVDHSQQKYRE